MKVASTAQMRKMDAMAIGEMGIPGILLMENAAREVVRCIVECLQEVKDKHILIFAGKGNNGGDGFAVARHLFNMGAEVKVILPHGEEGIQGDALINLNIIKQMDVPMMVVEEGTMQEIESLLGRCDLVIDSIFGTGLKGEITGVLKELIEKINHKSKYVLAVDIPSGIHGDTGEICGVCVQADVTVTFGLPKLGFFVYPAADYIGKLEVVDISIPESIIEEMKIQIHVIEEKHIKKLLPERKANSHKGDYGKVFIVAGSTGLTGAAALSTEAALRSGAGLVTVGVPKSLNPILEVKLTEAMTYPLEDEGKGILSSKCLSDLLKRIENMDAVAFGPGLSSQDDMTEILECILKNAQVPLVIDADGINVLAKNIGILKETQCSVVLTPHPGEMARMLGKDIKYIEKNRFDVAKSFAKEWKATVVLKGAKTVVALPTGELWINTTGNPGMARGGSGDVLTGMITSLIGQGLSPQYAAVAGVYVHGIAGDRAKEQKGEYGMLPSDMISVLPFVLKELRK